MKATPTSVLPFCSFSLRQAGLAPCSILFLLRCLALPLKKADQTLRQICHLWPHWKVTSMGQGLPACELRKGSNLQASHMPSPTTAERDIQTEEEFQASATVQFLDNKTWEEPCGGISLEKPFGAAGLLVRRNKWRESLGVAMSEGRRGKP